MVGGCDVSTKVTIFGKKGFFLSTKIFTLTQQAVAFTYLAPIWKTTWPLESWQWPCLLWKTVHWAFCPLQAASRTPVLVWTFFKGRASACSACHSLCWEGDWLQSAVSPGCVRPPGPWSQQVGLCLTPPDPNTICLGRLPLAGGCRWPEIKCCPHSPYTGHSTTELPHGEFFSL